MSVFKRPQGCGIGTLDPSPRQAIHLDASKNSFIPPVSILPMRQTGSTASECAVHPGAVLREGMLVGRSRGGDSVDIHSPIPGTVSQIKTITLPDGEESQAVVVKLGGFFDLLSSHKLGIPWQSIPTDRICSLAGERGIWPAYPGDPSPRDWDELRRKARVKLLIVRCIEQEPYLANCASIIRTRTQALAEGIRIAQKVLDPEAVVVARPKDPFSARTLEAALSGIERLRFFPCDNSYPLSEDRQLVKAIAGRELTRSEGLCANGFILSDAETLVLLHDAVAEGKPCIERYVTVAGDAIKHPGVFKTRIGTPIGDLIEECGGFAGKPHKLVMGGPLRGRRVADLDSPVLKGTAAVLALSRRECRDAETRECIRCGYCVDACPAGLDPSTIYKHIYAGYEKAAWDLGLAECTECGCCAYACPSRIGLVEGFARFRAGKGGR